MRRSALVLALAAGIVVPTVTTAAIAAAGPRSKSVAVAKGKPTAVPRASKTPAKPAKITFAANGTVTAVTDTALTLAVKGGTKDVKGASVTVVVPLAARVVVNDVRATIAEVEAGFRVTVTGTRVGTTYLADKLQASAPELTGTPDPDTEPSDGPSESPAADPTESATA